MAMVFCRGCGKEIHETAPTCPLCGAPQGLVARPVMAANPTVDAPPRKTVSARWLRKFALIDKAGGPKLPRIKDLSFWERPKVIFNVWGFLLGPFYYVAKGMWKKAIVLMLISMAIIVILEVMLDAAQISDAITYWVGPAIFAVRATLDYYKKVILGQNGWW